MVLLFTVNQMPMKKLTIFLFLLSAVISKSLAQESAEKTVFDYADTQHEFSLDILPIINGNYPGSLLYRKHYLTKNGKNAALRFGLNFENNFQKVETDFAPITSTNYRNNGFGLSMGKEWQKNFTPRNMGYYGVDLGFGYSGSSIQRDPNSFSIHKSNNFNYSALGFIGMKHHFSKNFSVSAESGVSGIFSNSSNTNNSGDASEQKTSTQRFGISLIPIRAVRFAFHF